MQDWRPHFQASHLSYTSRLNVQCQAIVKVHGVFPSCRGYTALHSELISLSLGWRQPGHHYAIRAGRTYPTRNFATLGPYSYGRRLPGLRSRASLALTPSINLPAPGRRHTVTSTFVIAQCCVLINSCSQLVSSTDFSSIREGLHLHISVPSPEVTAPFC